LFGYFERKKITEIENEVELIVFL